MGPTYVVSAPGVLTGIIAAILVCLLDIYFACLLGVLYKEFFPSGPNKVSTAGMNAGIGRCLLLFKRMLWAYLQLYISVNSVLKAFGSLPFWISFLASTWTTSACARELFCLTLLQFQLSRLFVVLCFISYFWEQGWLSFESTIIVTPAYTFQRLVTVNTRGSHCPSNGTLKPKKSLIKPVLVTHGCTDALASCHTKSRYTACHSGSQCHTAAPSSFFYRVKIHSCLQSFWIVLHRALFFFNLLMPMLKGSEDNTATCTVIPAATYTFERSVLESRVRWTPKSN